MQIIYVLRGLPGSGKSLKARLFISNTQNSFHERTWVRVNKDELRRMFHNGAFSRANEDFVHAVNMKLISMALSEGNNVVVDNTHITNDSVKPYHKLAEQLGGITVVEEWVDTPLDECLRRNALRESQECVPEHAIRNMAQKLSNKKLVNSSTEYPKKVEVACMQQDESLQKAVICDLDGTLALMNGRNPYDASMCDETDTPCSAVLACIKAMYNEDHEIIFMSGRDKKYYEPTMRFLDKYLPKVDDTRPFKYHDGEQRRMPFRLHMRAEGDTRKDSIVKRELFDEHIRGKYNISFVLDDRDQVVEVWRSMGLVCMQVRPGNF